MKEKNVIIKWICYAIFMIYVLVLMKIILFKYTGILPLFEKIISGDLDGFRSLNLIPFRTFIEFMNVDFLKGFVNLIGNILVFAPLGWFLPLIFKKCKELKNMIFVGVLISCFFECCQYIFYLGSADIDDIILNIVGVIFGFLCFKWLQDRYKPIIQYRITLILSVIGFAIATTVAMNYFGLMFGISKESKYDGNAVEEFENVQIETNVEDEFDILGDIISLKEEELIINQVIEMNENAALSSNDNRNLKTIYLLPSTKYSQMDIYDSEGKKVEIKDVKIEDLKPEQRIDIKGYKDGTRFFATEIVINNYLFS